MSDMEKGPFFLCKNIGGVNSRSAEKRRPKSKKITVEVEVRAYQNYVSLYRMQAEKLQYDEGQEESSGAYGNQQILQILQKAHITSRNKIISEG